MFRIKAKNFLPFEELDFDFSNRGLVLIEGHNKDENLYKSNGSGKTSLVDALSYGLYGKCVKASSPDKVVNLSAGKNCEVVVEWDQYRIVRYRKHTKHKNDLEFYINEEPVKAKSVQETQARIDKELGLSYDSFIKSVYFQQSTLASFANAKDSEQKAIIEDILNLTLLGDAQEWCKERSKWLADKTSTIHTKKAQSELLYNESKKRVQALDLKSEEWKKLIHQQKSVLWNQISDLEKAKEAFRSDFDFEQARAIIETARPLMDEFKPIQNKIYVLQERKASITSDKNKLAWQIDSLKERQIQQLGELEACRNKSLNCPTCGQEMDASIQARMISDLEKTVATTKTSIVEMTERLSQIEDVVPIDAEIEELKASLTKKQSIITLSAELQRKLEKEEKLVQEAALYDERIKQARQKVEDLCEAKDPYWEQSSEEIDKWTALEEKIAGFEAEIVSTEDDRRYYEYWVDGFSNSRLKSYIMDSITPYLNERANHYAQFLTGGAFQIDISTQTKLKSGELRDKFAVNLISQSGADYELASGGEKKRIDIAILLALQDLVRSRANMPINLVIFDEVSENIDSVGLERMIELLKDIATTQGSCFYVTHSEDMQALFPNVVRVVKEGGISKVIDG